MLCKEKFEDTKKLIRSRNSTDRQYNGHMKTMNDLQNATQKTENLTIRTPLKIGGM